MQKKTENPQRKMSGRRRQARELALQLLYAIEITGQSVNETIRQYAKLDDIPNKTPVCEFARNLIKTALKRLPEVDHSLQEVIANWKVGRLSSIDRNLLRLAACEIYYFDDIPPKVSINEYIEIAKDFGDDDSPSFINGILDRIAKESPKGKQDGEMEHAGGGT